ncbi:MAG: glycoside hydrolase family 13 protein [Eubacteriales bacterium]|nr:glycoside hydrolase family 13 protein [Eubacteriales bacterium]
MIQTVQAKYIQLLPEATTPRGAVPYARCRVPRRFGAQRAQLMVCPDGGAPTAYPLQWKGLEKDCDVYEGSLQAHDIGLFWLWVCVFSGGECAMMDRMGNEYGGGSEGAEQWTVYEADFSTPDWFCRGVTYQIFVDRFYRPGGILQKQDGRERVLHENWAERPVVTAQPGDMKNNDFFGGNLEGVIAKLPYLEKLGVATLYLNPVFEAASNHKYDTSDYLRVDPMFGSQETLRELCARAKERGMRVVLDAVFNHTGIDSVYFNAYGRYPGEGAAQSQSSPYYSWYTFAHWPDKYDCWWGVYTLPSVNETHPDYLDYIIRGKDSVVRHWLNCGVSGYRLDVVDELPREFVEPLRQAVKETDGDALVLGEVWEDASNKISYGVRRRYFLGHELDGVMNYPAREAIIRFVKGEISAQRCRDELDGLYAHYPRPARKALLNLLGSHDTMRILNVLGCEDADYRMDRLAKAAYSMTPEELTRAKTRLKQASLMLYMLPGSPCLYYGDEVGVQGFEDPMNRCTHPWEEDDGELLDWYGELGSMKREHSALHEGDFEMLSDGSEVCILKRRHGLETVTAIVNRSSKAYTYPVKQAVTPLAGRPALKDGGIAAPPMSAVAFVGE